jgi:prepilin-type N-terminal cleavage/methylation domain-containing protein
VSHHNPKTAGFTLIELMLSIALISVVTTSFFTFFNTSISQYLALHRDSLAFSDLATQTQRIGNVVRGLTDITLANNNELTAYAYFAPSDTYVSLIHYYLINGNTKMVADVTRMTSNPPIGTPIAGSLKTFTIIDTFYLPTNLNTFTYLDGSNTVLTPPISDEHTIKVIKISLAVPSKSPVASSNTTMIVEVDLRNRKTNL